MNQTNFLLQENMKVHQDRYRYSEDVAPDLLRIAQFLPTKDRVIAILLGVHISMRK
jgi:hypothetical protein